MGNKYFIGIDAGVHGAIARYGKNDGTLVIHDMPIFTISKQTKSRTTGKVKTKSRRTIDFAGVIDVLDSLTNEVEITTATIEKLQPMPSHGGIAAFRLGEGYGALVMALYYEGAPVSLLSPRHWKGKLGLTSDKDASLKLARRVFPSHGHYFKRKKDNDRAEAALLAWLSSWPLGVTLDEMLEAI